MSIFAMLKNMIGGVIHKLIPYRQIEQAGHFESPVSAEMSAALELWAQMYQNRPPWKNESDGMKSLNIPAFICSELSRQVLQEMKWNITGTKGTETSPRAEFLREQFRRCTGTLLREKLETAMAAGGMVIKPYVRGGQIFFDFSPDWCLYPICFDDDLHLTDVIFRDTHTDGKTVYTRLERHKVSGDSVTITQRCFRSQMPDSLGTECSLSAVGAWADLPREAVVSGTGGRPLFGWYRAANANNVDLDTVLGAAVFAKAAELIRDADEQYSSFRWEYKAKETAIDVDPTALLPQQQRGADGKRYELPRLNRRLFRAVELGQDSTYHVYDPPIRDESLLNGLNAILCRIEDACGLARGTVSDPNTQAMTATQIITQKQRTYETVRTNQQALEQCLRDVIAAADIYASAYHLAPAGDYEASFEWDDSIITDTSAQLQERMMMFNAGALSAAELRMWYFGETQEQAEEAVRKISAEKMQGMLNPDDLPQ